jgi:signal peptidase I
MKIRQNWFQIALTSFLLVYLVVFWIVFAPMQLGGQTAYIVINGTSMEPDYKSGDLIIVHRAFDYQIGDLVAYQNQDLQSNFFHRIIGKENERYILKGDNNPTADSYHPQKSEIIGKIWFQFINIGGLIQNLRIPAGILLVAILAFTLWEIIMKNDSKKRKRKRKVPIRYWGVIIEVLSLTFMVLLILSFGLCIFSFSRPLWVPVGRQTQYQHSGTFFYSAKVPPGFYDSTTLHDAEPIFPKLSCLLNIGFGYSFSGVQVQGLQGTYQVSAKILEEQSGWSRDILLTQATPFKEDLFVTNSSINLCQVENTVEALEQNTGLYPSYYTLTFSPKIEIAGFLEGQEFSDNFEPSLVFRFDKLHFYLFRENEQTDPLSSVKTSNIQVSKLEANSISFLGWIIDISFLRVMSVIVLVLSGSALLVLNIYITSLKIQSQVNTIKMKYSSLLVNARQNEITPVSKLIIVDTIDELAKLAEKFDTFIFYRKDAANHFYSVHANGNTYAYSFEEKLESFK